MNGRVYDPVLGRFLSADPFVQSPGDAQSYNRYSYLGNNPLGGTDPSGFFSLKEAVTIVAIVALSVVTAGAALAAVVPGMTFMGAMSAMFTAGGLTLGQAVIAGAAGGFASGFAGSLLNGGSIGDAFKAGIIGGVVGGVTAGLTYKIGGLAQSNKWNWGETALAHGVVQGGVSEATGGQFQHGFYAGFASSAAGGKIDGLGEAWGRAARIVASAVVGGTASALGGGKFANGAVSGAFVRMFNEEFHPSGDVVHKRGIMMEDSVAYRMKDGEFELDDQGNRIPSNTLKFMRADSNSLTREGVDTVIRTFGSTDELASGARALREQLGTDATLMILTHGGSFVGISQSGIGGSLVDDLTIKSIVGKAGWANPYLNHCQGIGGMIHTNAVQDANWYRMQIGSPKEWYTEGGNVWIRTR